MSNDRGMFCLWCVCLKVLALLCVLRWGMFYLWCVCLKVQALSCVSRYGFVLFEVCLPEGANAVVCLMIGVCYICRVFV